MFIIRSVYTRRPTGSSATRGHLRAPVIADIHPDGSSHPPPAISTAPRPPVTLKPGQGARDLNVHNAGALRRQTSTYLDAIAPGQRLAFPDPFRRLSRRVGDGGWPGKAGCRRAVHHPLTALPSTSSALLPALYFLPVRQGPRSHVFDTEGALVEGNQTDTHRARIMSVVLERPVTLKALAEAIAARTETDLEQEQVPGAARRVDRGGAGRGQAAVRRRRPARRCRERSVERKSSRYGPAIVRTERVGWHTYSEVSDRDLGEPGGLGGWARSPATADTQKAAAAIMEAGAVEPARLRAAARALASNS